MNTYTIVPISMLHNPFTFEDWLKLLSEMCKAFSLNFRII